MIKALRNFFKTYIEAVKFRLTGLMLPDTIFYMGKHRRVISYNLKEATLEGIKEPLTIEFIKKLLAPIS